MFFEGTVSFHEEESTGQSAVHTRLAHTLQNAIVPRTAHDNKETNACSECRGDLCQVTLHSLGGICVKEERVGRALVQRSGRKSSIEGLELKVARVTADAHAQV